MVWKCSLHFLLAVRVGDVVFVVVVVVVVEDEDGVEVGLGLLVVVPILFSFFIFDLEREIWCLGSKVLQCSIWRKL